MRGVNGTDSGGQTHVQKIQSDKSTTGGAITQKTGAARMTFGRHVAGSEANVQVINKCRGRQNGPNYTMLPAPLLPSSPVRALDSNPAVRDPRLSVCNSNHSTAEDIARGATASASSETKSATRPSVAETLKTLGVSVVSVKANTNERCVTLSYEGKNVILRQNVNDEGKFTNSVGVRANDANREKLLNELGNHKLTFLDLVTKLKPEDAPASGGFFSIISSLWS